MKGRQSIYLFMFLVELHKVLRNNSFIAMCLLCMKNNHESLMLAADNERNVEESTKRAG